MLNLVILSASSWWTKYSKNRRHLQHSWNKHHRSMWKHKRNQMIHSHHKRTRPSHHVWPPIQNINPSGHNSPHIFFCTMAQQHPSPSRGISRQVLPSGNCLWPWTWIRKTLQNNLWILRQSSLLPGNHKHNALLHIPRNILWSNWKPSGHAQRIQHQDRSSQEMKCWIGASTRLPSLSPVTI